MGNNILLSKDDKAIVLKEVKSIHSKLSYLQDLLVNDNLNENMLELLCGGVELSFADLSKAIGYNGETVEKVEKKYNECKELRMVIRELEEKLQSEDITDKISSQLSSLTATLKKWWKIEGFNYIHKIDYSSNGIANVSFGFNFDDFSNIYSSKPVSDAQKHNDWLKSLEDKGYIFIKNKNNKIIGLLDCDNNKKLLLKLLLTTFPTAMLGKIETQLNYTVLDKFEIQSVELSINNLSEIQKLKK